MAEELKQSVNTETKSAKKEHRSMGIRAKKNLSNTIMYVFMVVIAVIWLIPFFFIVLESLRCETPGQVGYVFLVKMLTRHSHLKEIHLVGT